jgi:hypothetical protein
MRNREVRVRNKEENEKRKGRGWMLKVWEETWREVEGGGRLLIGREEECCEVEERRNAVKSKGGGVK